jgi:nicotinamide riboside kinase
METIFVELMGGPGVGKSTLCADIFSSLKKMGIKCEMSLEFAKDLVWEESFTKMDNQLLIFGEQYHRFFRLNGKVQVVVSDSSLLNSIIYYKGDNPHFVESVLWEFKKFNTINLYLERTFEYDEIGRVQDEENAMKVDTQYRKLLDSNGIEYHSINLNVVDANNVVKLIESKLNG